MMEETEKTRILKKRADILKIPKETEVVSGPVIEGLEFMLASERYAINSEYIDEVLPLKDITPLPCTPDFIIGITNIRGKIISIIDLKKIINLPANKISNPCKIIIVRDNDIELGIMVDKIIGCNRLLLDNLQTNISALKENQDDYIAGITEDRLIYIDVNKILNDDIIIVNDTI